MRQRETITTLVQNISIENIWFEVYELKVIMTVNQSQKHCLDLVVHATKENKLYSC